MKSFVRSLVRVAATLAVFPLGAGVAAAQSADLGIEKWVFGLPGAPVAADVPFAYSIMALNNGVTTTASGVPLVHRAVTYTTTVTNISGYHYH